MYALCTWTCGICWLIEMTDEQCDEDRWRTRLVLCLVALGSPATNKYTRWLGVNACFPSHHGVLGLAWVGWGWIFRNENNDDATSIRLTALARPKNLQQIIHKKTQNRILLNKMSTHTMMLLIGMCINLTKNPMNPIIANPIAVAIAIFWNSVNK